MLARSSGAHKPKDEVEAPQPEGPSVESLEIPQADIEASGTVALLQLVQRAQQMRIRLFSTFDDAFEMLVTHGKADEYPGLVDRFKLKFAAIDDTQTRVCDRLQAMQPALVAMVKTVIREEQSRLMAKLDEQVLRQHLSTTDLESDERPGLKRRLQDVSASLASRAAAVEEALEELRCEMADLDDDDE
jgi:hypothetical protein